MESSSTTSGRTAGIWRVSLSLTMSTWYGSSSISRPTVKRICWIYVETRGEL